MDRRTVIWTVTVGLLAVSLTGAAQKPAKVWHIGLLSNSPRPADGSLPPPFRRALEQLGYFEGKNVRFTGRWAEADSERLPRLAAELVALDVDVMLTTGLPATEAAKVATSTIPIVFVAPGDAAATGLISNMSRPGGNITGVSDPATELSAKRLGVLKEAVPNATRIAVLWDTNDRAMTLRYGEVEKAARSLRLTIEPFGVRNSADIEAALSSMTGERPDALFVVSNALTNVNRRRILDFAAENHLPAMYEFSYYVRDGGLMSYGPNLDDMWERAAIYVDRIFKGSKPGDLPVEEPTRYYLLVNLKAAKALELTIPQPLLLRADEVVR